MSQRFSTALSHIVLAGTGIYCLYSYKGSGLSFPHLTFSIITANSLVGIWRYGNPDHGQKVNWFYRFTAFLQTILALPCLCMSHTLHPHTSLWDVAFVHGFICLGALALCVADHIFPKLKLKLIDVILAVNVFLLVRFAFKEQIYWGIAATVSFAFNHFAIGDEGCHFDIPAQDLYNYGMCFFALFALNSLGL